MPIITVEIGGKTYTGSYTERDVGKGKVMFEVFYGGEYHHDSSVFRRGEGQIEVWAKSELRRLIQQSLDRQKKPAE